MCVKNAKEKTVNIELTEEERKWLLGLCEKAKERESWCIFELPPKGSGEKMEMIELLINKLSAKK